MAKIIVIDPGHGGNDPGAVGNGLQEKELTLSISLRVTKLLRARGADVRLTRSDDRAFSTDKRTDLQARAAFANHAQADYFVSIHINAGGGTGFESYVVPSAVNAESGRRQDIVHREVVAVFQQAGLTDRGQKTANFAVLRGTTMPAILLECGFIDRIEDANQLKNPAFLDSVAQAIARGTAQALGLPNVAPVENPNSPAPANDPQPISKYYKDIIPGMEWAVSSVDQLYEWGIMRGDGQGNFRPTGTMTRLEAAVALHKAIEYVVKQMGK